MATPNPPQIHYVPTHTENIYPESDGKPLAETERHLRQIIRTLDLLETHFADIPDVYIWSNMMMYYEKGPPAKSVKPDIFVSFGIGRQERRLYKVWEEEKAPDFIMEFASKSTYETDLGGKKSIYAAMGVREYFLYDPYRLYLPFPLIGFRLVGSGYVAIPALADGRVLSETLGLAFVLVDAGVGIDDAVTGQRLQTKAERLQTEAEQEAAARRRAEAELAKLRLQLERVKDPTNT